MRSTERKQLRRYLLWGFGLSLVAHLILGPFLGRIHYSEAEKSEPTIVSVTKKTMRIATPKPTATPTPRPKPTPTPTPPPPTPKPTPPPTPPPPAPKQTQPPHKAAPAPPHLKVNVPKTTSTARNQPAENPYVSKPGTENGAPAGQGAAGAGTAQSAGAGTPGTPAANCAQPHVDPSTKNAVQPEYPEVAREQGAFGTVKVAVTLDEHGTVLSAAIAQSAGNAALDQEAIKAAKASSYSPEIVDCKPIGGVYLFRAVFDSQ